jgi:hypothetical protein
MGPLPLRRVLDILMTNERACSVPPVDSWMIKKTLTEIYTNIYVLDPKE